MDIMVEKPGWRRGAVGLWIAAVILSVITLVMFALCVQRGIVYNRVDRAGVIVEATGYQYRENHDEDLDFDVYVRFSYGGESYSVLYDTVDTRTEAENLIGRTVQLCINAEDPQEQLNDIGMSVRGLMFIAVPFLICAVTMLLERKRKLYTAVYGFTTEYIQIDVKRQLLYNISSWCGLLAASVIVLALRLCFPGAVGSIGVVGIIGMGISLLLALRWFRQVRQVRECEYYRSHQTVYDKKIDSGGDSTTYDLYLTNGVHQWTQNVSKKQYELAQIGDTTQTVFLKGAKKPFFTTNIIE